jgi:hypothetical protein
MGNNLTDRVIENLRRRREKVMGGGINSIPLPFPRFRNDWPGIEQGKYYLVTAATKGAKSQFGSFVFIFNSLLYAYKHPDQLDIKIFYYPLEETQEDIMERFMSYLLYTTSKGTIRISPNDLKSTNKDNPLDEKVIQLLESEEVRKILNYFEEHIFFSEVTNPTGIYKECRSYAEASGKTYYKEIPLKDAETGIVKKVSKFDYYEMNNKNEYRIIFIDHMSLITQESGMDLRQSMGKMSEYLVLLRNKYKYTPVVIQQQAMFENIEAFKMDKLKPSIATLADNKAISRDCNLCVSLFSPFKYELEKWMGYDITKLKDRVRFLEVLLNRGGVSNGVLPLYFDGAVNFFTELPKPNDEHNLQKFYNLIKNDYITNRKK